MTADTLTRAQRDRLANDLRLACMRLARRVRLESTDGLAPHLVAVLARVEDQSRTPRALAEIERVSAPSMTRNVACLVERGLVARTDDPADGRQVIVSITEDGRRTLGEIRVRRDQWLEARLAQLADDERALLAQASVLLERLASA